MKISFLYLFRSVESRLNHLNDISIVNNSNFLLKKIKIWTVFLLKFAFIISFKFFFARKKKNYYDSLVYDNFPRYKKLISRNLKNRTLLYLSDDIEINDVIRILKIRKDLEFFLTFTIKSLNIYPIDLLISTAKSIILFEGDDPWSMFRSYIAILFNAKSIVIQNGAFIFNKLSGSQINYICSDFITTSPFIVKRICDFSSKQIKWHLIDNPYLKFTTKPSYPKIYFVGQHALTNPLHKDSLSSKIQPLSIDHFNHRLCALFEEIKNLGFEVNYILHPLEKIPKEFESYFYFGLVDQFEFNVNDLVFGYYSSLLLELNMFGLNTFLLGSAYDGLVFESLLVESKTIHHYSLSTYDNNFDSIIKKVNHLRDNSCFSNRGRDQLTKSISLSMILKSLLAT